MMFSLLTALVKFVLETEASQTAQCSVPMLFAQNRLKFLQLVP